MTVGNYVRHCLVRSGRPALARAVPALVCGVRCVVLVWSISAVVLVSLYRRALYQFRT